jgi:hypothetical protein
MLISENEEIDFGRVPNYVHVREMVKVLSEDLVRSRFLAKKGRYKCVLGEAQ